MKHLFLITAFFILGNLTKAVAQQCTGSRGTPVVTFDFGQGTAPTGVPTGAGYTTNGLEDMSSNLCAGTGYALVSQVPNCHGGTWVTGLGDHTGNADGKMFLANVSSSPADFFTATVSGLVAGQAYDFRAWMSSIVKRLNNNYVGSQVQFMVYDGNTKLMDFTTPEFGPLAINATSTQWQSYGAAFVMPNNATGSVLLILRALGAGGTGNDFVIDDIQFTPVGPCINLVLSNCSSSGFQLQASVAANQNYDFNTNQPGNQFYTYNPASYQWQQSTDGGITWANIGSPTTTGTYSYTGLPPSQNRYRVIAAANNTNLTNANARVISNVVSINNCGLVLPVVFGTLDAQIKNQQLVVNWTTLSETGNSHFEVEWSADGKTFSKAGTVLTKANGGNASTSNSYQYTTSLSDLGAGVMALLPLLLGMAFRRRKRMVWLLAITVLVAVGAYSCGKTSETVTGGRNGGFVRIVQVDKDGSREESKVIKVTNGD